MPKKHFPSIHQDIVAQCPGSISLYQKIHEKKMNKTLIAVIAFDLVLTALISTTFAAAPP